MVFAKPHFLLFCDAHVSSRGAADNLPTGGRWHFVLERIDVTERLEAADSERAVPRDRLSLLAVVRGLEALEQPSAVTLVTTSRYVSRGLRYGLSEWREADYSWEHFGVQKPIRNADLWQRIDCALNFHEIDCRLLESSQALAVERPEESAVKRPMVEAQTEDALPAEVAASVIPAPHFRPRSTSNSAARSSGRPLELAASRARFRDPGWWQLAAGWMQWWKGRGARSSVLAGV